MRVVMLGFLVSACAIHDEHHIEAWWMIDRYGDGTGITVDGAAGVTVPCPSGWSTVRLVMVDPSNPQTRTVDTFPCDAGTGTSSYLPADSYMAWIEVADGEKLLAASPPTPTDVTSFGPILITDIYLDAGYATAVWPRADDVTIALTGSTMITTTFTGPSTSGLIGPVPAGHFAASVTVGDWHAPLPDVVITAPSGLTDLGVLAIPE